MGEDSVPSSPEWELGPHICFCYAHFYSVMSTTGVLPKT